MDEISRYIYAAFLILVAQKLIAILCSRVLSRRILRLFCGSVFVLSACLCHVQMTWSLKIFGRDGACETMPGFLCYMRC